MIFCYLIKIFCYLNKKINQRLKEKSINYKLKKQGFQNVKKIFTYTTNEELIALLEIASSCPHNAKVVEIGSYLGASTCYIAAGLSEKNALIYCIDTWQNETMPEGIKNTYEEFNDNLSFSKTQIIKIRKKSSEVTFKDLPKSIDFAFIDGDHSFPEVQNDIKIVKEIASNNSIIAFHDSKYYKGVSIGIGELLCTGDWRLEGCVNNLCWFRKYSFSQ